MNLQQVKTDLENGVLISPVTWLRVLETALELKGANDQMVDALRKLKSGAINVAENAKLRGDTYDVGYANAMAECCNAILATAATTES